MARTKFDHAVAHSFERYPPSLFTYSHSSFFRTKIDIIRARWSCLGGYWGGSRDADKVCRTELKVNVSVPLTAKHELFQL